MCYINKDQTLTAQLCNTGQCSFKDLSISPMLTEQREFSQQQSTYFTGEKDRMNVHRKIFEHMASAAKG